MVETHCYGIGRGVEHLLSDHVVVEIDGNVKRFNREGLRQLQCRRKEVIGPNIYSNHDIIRGAGVFDAVTGDRSRVIIIMRDYEY